MSSFPEQWLVIEPRQEGEVNTSDLADPMVMANTTSRRKKRANALIFENGVVDPRLLRRLLPELSFSDRWSRGTTALGTRLALGLTESKIFLL